MMSVVFVERSPTFNKTKTPHTYGTLIKLKMENFASQTKTTHAGGL